MTDRLLSDKPVHYSDCAIYNEPAYPAKPCDCGFEDRLTQYYKQKIRERNEILEVSRAAILDAVWCEDGLDGSAGEAVMNWITDILGDKETYQPTIEGLSEQTKIFRDKALKRQSRYLEEK